MHFMLKDLFKRIPYLEALRAFLEQWGIWAWVGFFVTAASSTLYAWWAWAYQSIPSWAAPLIGVAFVAALVVIFYYSLMIKQWFRAHRTDLPRLGARLVDFSERFAKSVNEYDRISSRLAVPSVPRDSEQAHQEWAQNVAASRAKSAWLAESHGGEIIYFMNELSRLGVQIPFHLTASIDYGASSLAAFFGYAGRMIKEGRLEELKAIDKDMEWKVSTMFR
ncbi:MAG TPA: hypothetical protein DD402_10295 [Sulfitobacter sp.]|nr:hypothetical protein [Sulfitobacter sp.]